VVESEAIARPSPPRNVGYLQSLDGCLGSWISNPADFFFGKHQIGDGPHGPHGPHGPWVGWALSLSNVSSDRKLSWVGTRRMNSRYSRWWFEPSFLGSCGSNNAIFTTHDWEWLISPCWRMSTCLSPGAAGGSGGSLDLGELAFLQKWGIENNLMVKAWAPSGQVSWDMQI
jgi:hypothetical protein